MPPPGPDNGHGMIDHGPGPGAQDGKAPDLSSDVMGVAAKLDKSVTCGPHDIDGPASGGMGLLCPRSSWMTRGFTPFCSRYVA
jgi:hypothetical protein